jgi:hypothetical protein
MPATINIKIGTPSPTPRPIPSGPVLLALTPLSSKLPPSVVSFGALTEVEKLDAVPAIGDPVGPREANDGKEVEGLGECNKSASEMLKGIDLHFSESETEM